MPQSLVRHYSGCFCEGVFGWDKRVNQCTLHKACCPSYYGWASPKQLKAWAEQQDWPPWSKKEFCGRDPWTWAAAFALLRSSSRPAHPTDFGLASLRNHTSHSLKRNIFLSAYTHLKQAEILAFAHIKIIRLIQGQMKSGTDEVRD